MISETDVPNIHEYHEEQLTKEEEHILQMLDKINGKIVWINHTQDGIKPGTLNEFKRYYSEEETSYILESLVRKRKLERIDHGIMVLCPTCNNYEVSLIKKCSNCGSSKLSIKRKIVHTPCEIWGTFEEFKGGSTITCPNCSETIDSITIEDNVAGFSYSDPYFECQECNHKSTKTSTLIICRSCNSKFEERSATQLEQTGYKIGLGASSEDLLPNETIPETTLVFETEITDQTETISIEEEHLIEDVMVKKVELVTPEVGFKEKYEPLNQIKIKEGVEVNTSYMEKRSYKNNLRVLIVDDDVLSNESLKYLIEAVMEQKCEIHSLYDGEKVIEEIEENKYDVVFLDNRLPHKTGLDILKELNEENSEANIIFITGFSDEETAVKAMKYGAKDYIPKGTTSADKIKKAIDDIILDPSTLKSQSNIVAENESVNVFEEVEPVHPEDVIENTDVKPSKVLMVVEDQMTSNYVIESLKELKIKIELFLIENGDMVLESLKKSYDMIILDGQIKEVDINYVLNEMAKLEIKTPIVFIDGGHIRNIPDNLNPVETIKRKQSDLRRIKTILPKYID